jgi:hypothetical protein
MAFTHRMKIRTFEPGDEAATAAFWREGRLKRPRNARCADIARKPAEQPEQVLVETLADALVAT